MKIGLRSPEEETCLSLEFWWGQLRKDYVEEYGTYKKPQIVPCCWNVKFDKGGQFIFLHL